MRPRLLKSSLILAVLALAACKGSNGGDNWSGNANVDYAGPRDVYRAPVVKSNAPRLGYQMSDAMRRSNFQQIQQPGLHGTGSLSSAANPMSAGSVPPSTTTKLNLMPRLSASNVAAARDVGGALSTTPLPNVGRRRMRMH